MIFLKKLIGSDSIVLGTICNNNQKIYSKHNALPYESSFENIKYAV